MHRIGQMYSRIPFGTKKDLYAVPVRCIFNEVKGYITGVRWYSEWKKVKARMFFFDLFGGVKCLLVFLN